MSDIPFTPNAAAFPEEAHSESALFAWLSTVDHKRVGLLYILAAGFFFIAGGLEALLMRIQLTVPVNDFLLPETYNQLFTMHGTTMIFFFAMPILTGMGNYFVPLMIGARDMMFPRLNALSVWLLIFGGLILYFSWFTGSAPSAGWFNYAPLNEKTFARHLGVDYYCISLLITGIGSIIAAVNLVVTILMLRAPGMWITRLPLFVWMTLIAQILILLALPPLNASLSMLLIDRHLGGNFFQPSAGGSSVLWQHYFWNFGHPEVYIVVLPAFGMISEVIPVFSRKPIFGYEFVAASTAAIGFLSFLVWAHHMFAVGLSNVTNFFFGAASMLIAVPTGIKIFNWTVTMWHGSVHFTTAMLFALGFLITFTMGGLSGVSFAVYPLDWQTTDTYYLVAHLHYVLFGGTVLGVLAGFHYWFPKLSGRMLSEKLGYATFWLILIGFHLTFLVQHWLGLIGMPRRIYTYSALPGWAWMNLVSTIGAGILGLGVLVLLANVIVSLRDGSPAGDNPWNAWTLEWATSSPPPEHNFELVPPVRSRRPLWDLEHPDALDPR